MCNLLSAAVSLDISRRGNGGMTFDESKSHFTAWALMKSPLLIGTNVSIDSSSLDMASD